MENKIKFWQKLNRKPISVYLRFQRMFAKHNKGKWIRGIVVDNGIVKFNLE
jgi:hypothetical protein